MPSPPRFRRPNPSWLLLLPAFALLVGVLLVPLARSVLQSLDLQNYRNLFTDGVTLTVLGRTAVVAAVVTTTAALLGYPYAYLMTRVGPRLRGLLLVVVLVPFWTSVMARNFAWIIILERGGPVNELFKLVGLDLVLYQTVPGVAVAMSQVLLPFMVLPLFSALGGIDRRLLLAARGLGSHPIRAFWRVYWPLSRRGLMSGLTLVFTLSLGFYVTPALIGPAQKSLVAQLLGQRTTVQLDFGGAGALGLLVLVVTLALVAWANRRGGTITAIGIGATPRAAVTRDRSKEPV